MTELSDLKAALTDNNLSGKAICVHSSIKSFGGIKNGPQTIIDAFLGENCTLLVPSFSWNYHVPPEQNQKPGQNGWDYTYTLDNYSNKVYSADSLDVDKDMGILPKTVVNMQGRARGNHPLMSFSAIGEFADSLIKGQEPLNVYYPLEKLVNIDGYIILMGVGYESLTLIHLAEKLAGRNPFRRWARNAGGETVMAETGGCSDGFSKFDECFKNIVKETIVGKSVWKILKAREAVLIAADIIKRYPEITKCDDENCQRCNDAIKGGPIL